MKELKIDPELRDLLPPLTDSEYKQLEKNIVENGFDRNFPIMEWHGFIVDGHNRYSICEKHKIDYVVGTLAYETKEEVMEWMLDIQLGRRNLTPIQRITVAEKYRPIYEKQAKKNLRQAGSSYGVGQKKPLVNLPNPIQSVNTSEKLASIADVSEKTYRMGAKILNSDNEDLKNKVLSGETSISAGYKELIQNNKFQNEEIKNTNGELDNVQQSPTKPNTLKSQSKVSDEVKQICEDLKTEKSKKYLDSIWDYKISVIECMNADFDMYYGGFVSILQEMNGRVTETELRECITNAENIVEKMLSAIEEAKNIDLKTED